LIGMDLVRLGLERAATAASAVEEITALIERYGQGGSGHVGANRPYFSSFLVADGAGAFVIETSDREWCVESVECARALSNRTSIAAFDAVHRHPKAPLALVDPRWYASQALLDCRPVTVEALKAHLRSHVGNEGYSVCMHVPGVEMTTASMIAVLPPAAGGGRERAIRVHVLHGSPCASIYVPMFVGRAVGSPPAWRRFAALPRDSVEARAAFDALEAELERDARDDDRWAGEAWGRVDHALTALGVA
jgi:hypothetical protein